LQSPEFKPQTAKKKKEKKRERMKEKKKQARKKKAVMSWLPHGPALPSSLDHLFTSGP
jgi:hypothetical protein